MSAIIKKYYYLAKPGIVRSNALAAAAGFVFASSGAINWGVFAAMLLGLIGIIASGCVFNNYYDRDIDARMERTAKRALVRGTISDAHALIYGTVLGVLGGAVLLLYTNFLTFAVALVGFGVYVLLYTPVKHKHPVALFIGAVAGAVPPVVGYVAVTNTFDWWAVVLFTFLYVWQLVHFMAIAVYRYDEYTAAGVPLYIKERPSDATKQKAKKVFHVSLVVLLLFCAGLVVYSLLTLFKIII